MDELCEFSGDNVGIIHERVSSLTRLDNDQKWDVVIYRSIEMEWVCVARLTRD